MYWQFHVLHAFLFATYTSGSNTFRILEGHIALLTNLLCLRGSRDTNKVSKERVFPSFGSVKPWNSKFFVLVWRKGKRRFMYDRLIVHLIWRMQNCKTSWWIYSRQIFWQRITATTVNFTLCSNKEKSKQMVLHNQNLFGYYDSCFSKLIMS